MKIGIVSNLYPPWARGGAENVVVRTVAELLGQNHDVFVITASPKKGGSDVRQDQTTTERVYRFFPRNLYFLLDDYKHTKFVRLFWHIIDAFAWSGAQRVQWILEDEMPDVVVTHNLKGIGLRIPRAIQHMRIPHVHLVHDLQLIYPSGLLFAGYEREGLRKPFYMLYRWVCRARMGKPDFVIFPSSYLRDVYLKHGFFKDANITVMPNPAPRLDGREGGLRSPGPLRILFVGQLEAHKGIHFLIEEFRKLDIDAKLIIAGEGTYVERVKRASEQDKRIVYLGYISGEQLMSCFGIADALVVPSLCYENSPTVIYESLSAGVPVIASNIGGVGELVEDGANGFLFKAGSKADFVRVLWKLDEKKEQFASRRAEIRKTVEPYTLDRYGKTLVDLLKTVVEARGEKS